ncbi:MAG: hypothetical protein ACYS9X_12625 [Planctomycetota bacterium]
MTGPDAASPSAKDATGRPGSSAAAPPAPAEPPPPRFTEPEGRAFEAVPENAAGADALGRGANPWVYWGEFARHSSLVRPAWRERDCIADGWDWSLPSHVRPSPHAKVRWGFHGWKAGKIPKARFPEGVAVVDEVWWSWRKLEPEEGRFEFDALRAAIKERIDAGCAGVVIRLLGSVWEVGRPEQWREWEKKGKWRFGRWSAPRWLADLGARKVEQEKGGQRVVHMDIFAPVYHERYLRMVKAFGESGLAAAPEVAGLIICGMSFSNGEEASGIKIDTPERERRWRERLGAWIDAFGPHRAKLVAMGDGPVASINRELGLGSRDGFVEMYLYHTNDPDRGQFIDDDRYLCVDESNAYVSDPAVIFGDENEEYSDRYADAPGRPGRFGPIESFGYRYFSSMLRLLQMRRSYLYTEENAVIPELLWYVCHGLGRRAEDSPDAWCFLRESYLSPWSNPKPHASPGPLKNFERWLHQRDRPGYETTPSVRIPHFAKKWWLADGKRRYDYVAREGARIGFAVGDRFMTGRERRVAVKVSYYDGYRGAWRLVFKNSGREARSAPVTTTGRDGFRTATLFVEADLDAKGYDFDFEIHCEGRVPVSFVRVIALDGR